MQGIATVALLPKISDFYLVEFNGVIKLNSTSKLWKCHAFPQDIACRTAIVDMIQ